MQDVKKYWNNKFSQKDKIWGGAPSKAAANMLDFLKKNDIDNGKILDLACGYGRDTYYFAEAGWETKGIDISTSAINIANQYAMETIDFIVGDILDLPFDKESFRVVFGNFILHLLSPAQRTQALRESYRVLREGGVGAFSVASVEDPDYGVGEKVAKNTFVNSRGVTKYYFSKQAIYEEFNLFNIKDIQTIEENHDHGIPHTHISYLIIFKKGC